MASRKKTAPQRAGRSKQSQARLDAILDAIGDDDRALGRLLTVIAAAADRPRRAVRHQLVVDKSTAG